MHNISPKHITFLIQELYDNQDQIDEKWFLDRVRELYETTLLLQFTSQKEKDILENPSQQSAEELFFIESLEEMKTEAQAFQEKTVESKPKESENTIDFIPHNDVEHIDKNVEQAQPKSELSVEERIKEIMDKAAQFHQTNPTLSFPENESTPIEKTPEQNDKTTEKPTLKPHISLEEEMKVSYSAQFTADIFEKAEKVASVKKSLNDKLSQETIQIGLNDRIAFVKHLFDGNLSEFSRVVSQLNSFQSLEEANHFVEQVVKQDYDWSGKEDYQQRFMDLIARKFW